MDAVPPPQAALSPTTPSTAPTPAPGCAASKFFVPLIHAAHADHLTRNAGPAPPPEITASINAAHQAYDLWAADVVVPSWTATIRAIVPPIAGITNGTGPRTRMPMATPTSKPTPRPRLPSTFQTQLHQGALEAGFACWLPRTDPQ